MNKEVLGLAMLLVASPAGADQADTCAEIPGDALPAKLFYEACQSAQPELACSLYPRGFVEGVGAAEIVLGRKLLCPPPKLSSNQVRDVVLAYLHTHPREREACGMQVVAMAALLGVWGCKR
jgi:hypothetical protein